MPPETEPDTAALAHIEAAERRTLEDPRATGPARSLSHIGVIGGGTMGAGIAACALLNGFTVTMIERDTPAADAGAARVADILAGAHKRGKLTDEGLNEAQGRFGAHATYTALADCDLVIEAVFEDMDVKKAVFEQLDAHTKPSTILATNTSYLDINEIAATTRDPSRVIGLHFFSPAHIMKLLEIVLPDAVADDVVATAAELSKRLRKIGVLSGVCDGFIGNRIMSAYRREADYLIEDGALPWEVDAAMRAYGFPIGVFEMQDLAGLDIAWAMRKRRAATRPASERYVHIADRLCEAGHFGRKTGRGWYSYDSGKAQPSPDTEALIEAERARQGVTPRSFTADEVMARILAALTAEAHAVLDEGIARSAADIDVVMVNGYGFPRKRGGPMFRASA